MLSQLRGELTTCTKCSNVHCCCCCNSSLSETATSLCHISASSLTCVVSCLQYQMSKEKKSCKEINLELKMGSSCPTTTKGLLFQNWNYWTETLLEGRRTDGCLFTFTYCSWPVIAWSACQTVGFKIQPFSSIVRTMRLTIWPVSTWLFLWIPPGHIRFHSLVFISPMYWVNLIIPFKQKDYNGGNACKESPSKNVWYYSSPRRAFASSSSNRLSVRHIIWGMYQFIMKTLVLSLHMAPINSFSRKTSVILAFRNLLTCKTQRVLLCTHE